MEPVLLEILKVQIIELQEILEALKNPDTKIQDKYHEKALLLHDIELLQ